MGERVCKILHIDMGNPFITKILVETVTKYREWIYIDPEIEPLLKYGKLYIFEDPGYSHNLIAKVNPATAMQTFNYRRLHDR